MFNKLLTNFQIIINIVSYNIKVIYGRAFLGKFWMSLRTIVQVLIFCLIFTRVININIENYFLFLACNLTLFIFISSSISISLKSIESRGSLLKKVNFSKEILVFADILQQFYVYFVTILISVILFSIFNGKLVFNIYYLMSPFYFLYILLFLFFICYSISILYIYVNDLSYLIELGNIILMWITPINYPVNMLPSKLVQEYLMYFNPYFILIQSINDILYSGKLPSLIFHFAMFIWLLFAFLIFYFTRKKLSKKIVYYI